jgi:hypothetical protein
MVVVLEQNGGLFTSPLHPIKGPHAVLISQTHQHGQASRIIEKGLLENVNIF